MTQVKCPHCKGGIRFDSSLAGQVVACPHCKKQFRWPAIAQAKELPQTPEREGSAPAIQIAADHRPTSRLMSTRTPSVVGFNQFVTPTIVQILWILSLLVAIGIFLATVFAAVYVVSTSNEADGTWAGGSIAALVLLGFNVFSLFWLLYVRILLESIIIMFRVEEHLRFMREHAGK